MRITVDTNVLVRALLQDDLKQSPIASDLLRNASMISVPLPCLCELIWILQRTAKFSPSEIAQAIRALMGTHNVVMNRPAVQAGLAVLEAGGDFADGVMEFEGASLGGEIFYSFDKKAISLLEKQGKAVYLLK
ncbi:type II toxin-antitoxin system VapC family toxin [Wielerella bovis]|uniref:type II toxin-antitoxin system VapC family toxin n=1 Tax=Wielerella bovis TaxID=2917790 RepID=UPI0020196566|nr:type II toxin-antitoxin system VapC family toxin [Wielerella bovis]ULJ62515.1 type II toxin-antitoxin system VapC family toxin [Wielerella bovis]